MVMLSRGWRCGFGGLAALGGVWNLQVLVEVEKSPSKRVFPANIWGESTGPALPHAVSYVDPQVFQIWTAP